MAVRHCAVSCSLAVVLIAPFDFHITTQSNLNTLHVVSTVLAVRVNGHAVVRCIEQFLVRHVHRAVLRQVEGVGAGGSAGQAVTLAHGLHKDAAGQPAPARDEAQELASFFIGEPLQC